MVIDNRSLRSRLVLALSLALLPCTALLAGCPDDDKKAEVPDAQAAAPVVKPASTPEASTPVTTASVAAPVEAADAGKADGAAAPKPDAGKVGDGGSAPAKK